jgi:putative tryptophan/tyrosine transport system substrate-binding protein
VNRRAFITLLGGAALAWPLAARAQQPATPVVGFLSSLPNPPTWLPRSGAGLGEAGFTEGQNCLIAFRWAEGRYDRLPALAAELVTLRVAVLFTAGGTPPALAAKAATSTIPVVFSASNDPVRVGLVPSLNRPGGNVTGMALAGKRLELMKELVPSASAVAYLVNPTTPTAEVEAQEAGSAARTLGIDVRILNASTEQEIDAAFASLTRLRVGALIVAGEPYFDSQRDRLVALSLREAIPAGFAWREYVAAGGLMSYGTSLTESYRQAGGYVGRILKGEKPAELPIMQPTAFELALNLKTAKRLGLEVPAPLLARAL